MDGGQGRAKSHATVALNAAALDKRLQLRRRAREDGARNLPRVDAQDLSEAERLVVEAVAGERARLEQARADARADAERRMRALAPTRQDVSGPALEARLALKQIESRLAHDWGAAAKRMREAESDLETFKRAHNLRRAAHYPSSTLMQAGLLFLAALFEALFSATLFAETDPRGLLGGAVTAIGLSGANVVLGFLAGYIGLRYLQHVRLPIKTGGALAFALLLGFAIVLNWGAAGWRDALAQFDPAADATPSLWSSILHLHSPQSVVLLMLGAGVWVFATLKGYAKFDDPYPDYGKMDRSARDAGEDLSDFRAEARVELDAPIDTARVALAARIEKMRAECEAMTKAFDAAALKMEALDARARALDDAATSAVQLYRQENIAARATPAPAYFGAPPPSGGPSLDALAGCASMLDEARALLAEAQEHSNAALEGLVAELDTAQARLDAVAPG